MPTFEDWITDLGNQLLGFLDRMATAMERLVEIAEEDAAEDAKADG